MYEKEGRYYSSMNEAFCEYFIEFVATAEKGYFLRIDSLVAGSWWWWLKY